MALNLTDDELIDAVKRIPKSDKLVTEVLRRFEEATDPANEMNTFARNVISISGKIEIDDFLKVFKIDIGFLQDPRISPLLTQFSQDYITSLGDNKIDYSKILFKNEDAVTILTLVQVFIDRKDRIRQTQSLKRIRIQKG